MSRQYYGVEAINLSAQQRQTLVHGLKQLGRSDDHAQPAWRNHWRIRLDNLAVIFEGDFADESWTVESIKNRLANLFNVDADSIDAQVQQTAYGPLATFTRGPATVRLVAFGGLLATWQESRAAALAYLAANREAWEAA